MRRIIAISFETPRRFWIAIPGLGEVRFYRWGVEVYIGPSRRFLALEAGTLGFGAQWVNSPI